MFIYQTQIKLHHTDAAGWLFFSKQFEIIHDAYEAWMETLGLPLGPMIQEGQWALPIVHAEGQFKKPLRTGDLIEIQLTVIKISDSSLSLSYSLLNTQLELVGSAQTVHTCVNYKTGKKNTLQKEWHEKFSRDKT